MFAKSQNCSATSAGLHSALAAAALWSSNVSDLAHRGHFTGSGHPSGLPCGSRGTLGIGWVRIGEATQHSADIHRRPDSGPNAFGTEIGQLLPLMCKEETKEDPKKLEDILVPLKF